MPVAWVAGALLAVVGGLVAWVVAVVGVVDAIRQRIGRCSSKPAAGSRSRAGRRTPKPSARIR